MATNPKDQIIYQHGDDIFKRLDFSPHEAVEALRLLTSSMNSDDVRNCAEVLGVGTGTMDEAELTLMALRLSKIHAGMKAFGELERATQAQLVAMAIATHGKEAHEDKEVAGNLFSMRDQDEAQAIYETLYGIGARKHPDAPVPMLLADIKSREDGMTDCLFLRRSDQFVSRCQVAEAELRSSISSALHTCVLPQTPVLKRNGYRFGIHQGDRVMTFRGRTAEPVKAPAWENN